ncbi:MAG: MATE family efflux transporter [Bdellovibrionia bacterium]
MFELALPVIISYLGIMTMGLVDLICVGRVSPAALGAVGVGTSIFSWFMIFGMGLLTGLDYLVAHAYGAGKKHDAHLSWAQGFWVSWILGAPMTLALLYVSHHLEWFGINPEVIAPSRDYLFILSLSLIPVYLFASSRQFLQAQGIARPAAVILILSNVMNALANWVLVLGHAGFPAMGATGSAYATLIARVFMVAAMFGVHYLYDRRKDHHFEKYGIPFDRESMRKLLKLGIPSALQMTFEVGGFAFSTTLAARLASEALAAHQIVLNIASMTFMVPLGISSATAVLVGREMGRGDKSAAAKVGWKGLAMGVGFMAISSLCLLLFSTRLIELYTTNPSVHAMAMNILLIAALFQLSDGAQVVASGALRGLADTKTSMIANLLGHWGIGIPIGIALCFSYGRGLTGLWTGLALGLTAVAACLVWRWIHLCRKTAQV